MKKILIAFFATLLILSACGSDDNTKKKTEEKTEKKVEKKVEYTCEFTKDGGVVVNLTNPENEIVNINVEITYFNEAEKEIKKDSIEVVNVDVLAEVKTVFRNIPDDAKDYAVETSYEVIENIESFANILDTTAKDSGKDVTINVSNYNDVIISNANIGVIFYDDNKIVAYNEVVFSDIAAKGSAQNVVNYPVDSSGNDIMFDRVIADTNNAYNLKK